jgi:hypothetical protein
MNRKFRQCEPEEAAERYVSEAAVKHYDVRSSKTAGGGGCAINLGGDASTTAAIGQ